MARLVTTGFELNDTSLTSSSSPDGFPAQAGPTCTTSTPRSGSRCLELVYSVGSAVGWQLAAPALVDNRTYFLRFYMRIVGSLPTTGKIILWGDGTGASRPVISLGTNGILTFESQLGGASTSGSTVLNVDQWYRVEARIKYSTTAGAEEYELRLDEFTEIATQTGTFFVAPVIPILGSGLTNSAGAATIRFDDVAFNDDQGANQNTWPGRGKIVLFLPIIDNSTGTGWTLGTGTAPGGNAFNSLDNTPPLGVADLAAGSDPKQVRNATSNANTTVDLDTETYESKGIDIESTINVIDVIVATAAPVTTSAKQGTIGLSANPTVANIALSAGGTAGAFWSGTAAGTYPTGWKWSHGTITYNVLPSNLSLISGPVVRLTQVTASTRIAMACFAGVYVEYVAHESVSPYVHSEAKNRASIW